MLRANSLGRGLITIYPGHPAARQMKSSLRHFGFLESAARRNSGQAHGYLEVVRQRHTGLHTAAVPLMRLRTFVKVVTAIASLISTNA